MENLAEIGHEIIVKAFHDPTVWRLVIPWWLDSSPLWNALPTFWVSQPQSSWSPPREFFPPTLLSFPQSEEDRMVAKIKYF
jgi:hypothetical protein